MRESMRLAEFYVAQCPDQQVDSFNELTFRMAGCRACE
jgi:hypothetical protein